VGKTSGCERTETTASDKPRRHREFGPGSLAPSYHQTWLRWGKTAHLQLLNFSGLEANRTSPRPQAVPAALPFLSPAGSTGACKLRPGQDKLSFSVVNKERSSCVLSKRAFVSP